MFQAMASYLRSTPHPQGQWMSWLAKACLAAGAVFGLGMLTLGLPGAVFVELVTGLGRSVPPDGAWPLAIEVTAVGSLLIVPASLAVRLARPNLMGWGHAWATAAMAFVATALFTVYASSDGSSAAQQGPESLVGLVAHDIDRAVPFIAVGSGPHRFRLNFAASGSGSVYLSPSSGIDGMVPHRGVQSGQPIRFDPQNSIRTFVGLYPGDYAIVRNTSGHFMLLKIVSVTSKDAGGAGDAVVFEYQINEGKWPGFTAR